MTPANQLAGLLRQWHDLTLSESRAIEAEAWDDLAVLQRDKVGLKVQIMDMDPEGRQQRATLRPELAALIDLEKKNLAAIQDRMAAVQTRIAGLDANRRQLRQVRGAYAHRGPRPLGCVGTA